MSEFHRHNDGVFDIFDGAEGFNNDKEQKVDIDFSDVVAVFDLISEFVSDRGKQNGFVFLGQMRIPDLPDERIAIRIIAVQATTLPRSPYLRLTAIICSYAADLEQFSAVTYIFLSVCSEIYSAIWTNCIPTRRS